ncbi:unnamed protein product [Schistosoma mattheei]|uniref:Uncharacterized protein n=1 Tax=Schistosoma mattheei TaxID=31246 RepID=A0A183P954_9TREM|nr:unnamed protein product [Schistosoma mattheei]
MKNVLQKSPARRYCINCIRPDLRFITYCTAIRHGGQEEWKLLQSQLTLNDTVNENENANNMLALTCSRDKEIMISSPCLSSAEHNCLDVRIEDPEFDVGVI